MGKYILVHRLDQVVGHLGVPTGNDKHPYEWKVITLGSFTSISTGAAKLPSDPKLLDTKLSEGHVVPVNSRDYVSIDAPVTDAQWKQEDIQKAFDYEWSNWNVEWKEQILAKRENVQQRRRK